MTAIGTATRRRVALALPALLIAAAALAADAPPADVSHGKVLYLRHCIACHGTRAWGDGPREIPAIAGQHPAYLSEQLTRFASGERPGSAVHGPAMHDTLKATDVNRPAAIRDLAAYLALAPAAPGADQGEGRALALGRSVYLRSCSSCHGEDGLGRDGGTPRIAAQHYRYLLSRLREFAAVHGAGAAAPVTSAGEQQALADYISRLPASR